MSGGRSTVAHARGKRLAAQSGDISCIHSIGQQFAEEFFCECKFYKDLDLASLLIGKGKLAEFWSIASQEAARYDKSPFLIAKENRRPVLACLDGEGLKLLQLTRRCSLTVPPLNLYIVLFSTFETKAVKFWQE